MCSNFVGLWGKSQDPGPTTGGDPGKPPFGLGSDFKEQHIRRKGDPEVIRLLHDHSLAAHPQVSQTIPSPDTGSRRSHIAHVFKNLEKEKKKPFWSKIRSSQFSDYPTNNYSNTKSSTGISSLIRQLDHK